MAFKKVDYVNNQTVITAENMNDIQDEIIRQAGEISRQSREIDNQYLISKQFQILGADDVIEYNNLMGKDPIMGYRLNFDAIGESPELIEGEYTCSRLITPISSDTPVYIGCGKGTIVYLDDKKRVCGYNNSDTFEVNKITVHPSNAKYIMAFFPNNIYKSARFVSVRDTAYIMRGNGEVITGRRSDIAKNKGGSLWYYCGDSIAYTGNSVVMKEIAEDLCIDAISNATSTRGWLTSGYNFGSQVADAVANYNTCLITAWGSLNDVRLETYPTTEEFVKGLRTALDNTLEVIYESERIPPFALITPLPWANDEDATYEVCESYAEAMIEWAKENNIPCLDLFHNSGLNPHNENFASRYFMDPVHPNSLGLSTFVYSKIKDFIDSNCMKSKEYSLDLVRTRIVVQPRSVECAIGDMVTYSVVATGANLVYQWQYKTQANSPWYDITSFDGFNTDTMTLEATSSRIGRIFRCKITDGNRNVVVTESVTLNEDASPGTDTELDVTLSYREKYLIGKETSSTYKGLPLEMTNGTYLYKISEPVNITDCKSLLISGWAYGGYGLYSFLDSEQKHVSGRWSVTSSSDGGDTLNKEPVEIPEGATYIIVAGHDNYMMPTLTKVYV